jgi:transposase
MNMHKNARLTPRGRERIVRQVESGQTPETVAEAAGVCPRTVRKWVGRYRREGLAGLQDRSSRPHRLHRPTPQAVIENIERLRRQRWTGKQIAVEVAVSSATVSRVLRRLGLNKLNALEPAEPVRRYEREKPGELIHLDIKKLGRIGSVGHRITGRNPGAVNRHLGIGWEFVHVCIDDTSRVASVQVRANQRKESAVAFLEVAVAYFAKLGRSGQPVNASAFVRSSPGRTLRRPTEKLNASFKPRFANRPTPAPIRTRISDQPSCSTGSTATIGIGHMVACKPTRLSVASVYQRITC